MLRPIDGDGICSVSTGRPGFENAPAVAEPPTAATRPDNRAAPMVAMASRRGKRVAAPRNFRTSPKYDIALYPPNFHLPHDAVESVRRQSNTRGGRSSPVVAVIGDRGWLTIEPRTGIGNSSTYETRRRNNVEAVAIPINAAATSTTTSAGLNGVPMSSARNASTS